MRFVVPVSLAALLIQAPVGSAEPRLALVPESTWTDARRRSSPASAPPAGLQTRSDLSASSSARREHPAVRAVSRTSQPRRAIASCSFCGPPGCIALNTSGHSTPAAPGTGITSAELTRIARGPEASGGSVRSGPSSAADELCFNSFVSDRTWSALSAKYDTAHQAMDAVFTVAEFTMIAGAVNSLGVPVDDGHKDRLPSDIPYTVTAARTNERLIGKQARVAALEPTEWSPEVRQWLARYSGGRSVAGIYRMYAAPGHGPASHTRV